MSAASLDSPTLLAVFQALPGAYLLLSPELIIEEVSEAYLGEALTGRGQLIGRYLFEVFPDNPQAPQAHAVRNLQASLQQVLATGQPHHMAVQRYDVPNPKLPGQFIERYWRPTNTPIQDADGRVRHLLHSVVNVTDQQHTAAQLRASQHRAQTAQADADHRRAQLARAFQQVPAAICLLNGPNLVFELVNPAFQAILPTRTLLGKPILDALPELAGHPVYQSLRHVYESGQTHQETSRGVSLARTADGVPEERYFTYMQQARYDEQGRVDGVLVFGFEVTPQVQASQLVRATIDSSTAIIQAFDAVRDETGRIVDFRWTLVNERAAAQYDTDLVGQRLLALNPGVVETGIFARFVQVVESGQPQAYEQFYRHEQYDGWFEQSVVRLGDGLVSTTTNITARKQAQEALRAAHARTVDILESTTDAFYALDADFRFTYINQRAARLWGRDPDTLLGRHYWTEFPAAVGSFSYHQHYRVQAEGQPTHFETVSPLVGIWIDVSIFPSSGGNLSVFFRDITARKQAMHQLQVSNEQLRRVNADLDNFIYTASHDLKAPIANNEGLLLALQQELPAAAYGGQVPTILRLMQDAIDRFGRTIGHLTDISRLQQEYGQPATQVQVAPVVHEVLLDLAPLITQTKAQLTIDVPEQVRLNFSAKNLRSVVYNLLSNALKYRYPDRIPQISINCQLQADYQVLAVQDNGLGLDLTQSTEQVFGMFQRMHTHVEGTGIGLYMVKRILENAGGRIEVQSQPGLGTTFLAYFLQVQEGANSATQPGSTSYPLSVLQGQTP